MHQEVRGFRLSDDRRITAVHAITHAVTARRAVLVAISAPSWLSRAPANRVTSVTRG